VFEEGRREDRESAASLGYRHEALRWCCTHWGLAWRGSRIGSDGRALDSCEGRPCSRRYAAEPRGEPRPQAVVGVAIVDFECRSNNRRICIQLDHYSDVDTARHFPPG